LKILEGILYQNDDGDCMPMHCSRCQGQSLGQNFSRIIFITLGLTGEEKERERDTVIG